MATNGANKHIKCKAAISRVAGEPLQIKEVVVAPPKAYEVRIKTICTSLFHTDVTLWRMKEGPLVAHPVIFGHEAVGKIESVGEHVDEFKVGDLVVPTFLAQCNECAVCTSECSNFCIQYEFGAGHFMPRDGTSRFANAKGELIHHFLGISSFSQCMVVDAAYVTKVDPAIAPEKACLLSCGISSGIGGAWKVAEVKEGSTVAIFGLGSIGLAVIIEMTKGGADYCFECIGIASVMNDAFKSARKGWGKTIILGFEMHGAPLCIGSYDLLMGKCVMGALLGGIKPKSDIPTLANKYLNKELQLDKFITHEVGLEEINTTFDLLLEGKSLRCMIWMDKRRKAKVNDLATHFSIKKEISKLNTCCSVPKKIKDVFVFQAS